MTNINKDVKLSTKNMFKVVKIIDKTEIFEEIGELYSSMADESNQESLGFAITRAIIKALDKAENELYELIADIEGKTPEEIEEQDFVDTIETIESIIMSEKVQGFIKKYRK